MDIALESEGSRRNETVDCGCEVVNLPQHPRHHHQPCLRPRKPPASPPPLTPKPSASPSPPTVPAPSQTSPPRNPKTPATGPSSRTRSRSPACCSQAGIFCRPGWRACSVLRLCIFRCWCGFRCMGEECVPRLLGDGDGLGTSDSWVSFGATNWLLFRRTHI